MKENVMQGAEMIGEEKRGITGSTLKWFAMIAMLIDHTAAILLENYLQVKLAGLEMGNLEAIEPYKNIYYLDIAMRMIGRVAFPIFAFLLVEGFLHTRNVKKYVLNLGIFALISEIPFSLAFEKKLFGLGYQNVFFTLLIGLIVMIGLKTIGELYQGRKFIVVVMDFSIITIGMGAAFVLKTDYSLFGVVVIALMYLLRRRRMLQSAVGCVVLCTMSIITEITSFFALIPIHLYNGERGTNHKYLFYIFYPAHILILYFIAMALKLV